MLYIILAIVLVVYLFAVFKLFSRFGVNTFHAIIINYFVAGVTGLIYCGKSLSTDYFLGVPIIYIYVPLGVLFISVFYLISLTVQRISMATASVANKMSVVMPVLFSVIFVGENLSLLKGIGIIVALVAVYLTTKVKEVNNGVNKKTLLWLPVLVFFGSGLIDTTVNAAKTFYLNSSSEEEMFCIGAFFSAFITGLLVIGFKKLRGNQVPEKSSFFKSLIGGLALGIPNFFSIAFTLRALDEKVLSAAQLFPVLNISNVVLAAVVGYMIFKEKLSLTNIIGILLAVISIILIAS